MRPLVYIAALRRTGSTLLCEALSLPPSSLILIEPSLCVNDFGLHEADARTLGEYDIDVAAQAARIRRGSWLRRRLGVDDGYAVRMFKRLVVPRLATKIGQIGVKEIRNPGWRHYREQFPDMRVVLTARDPRDVFISLHHRVRKGEGSWEGPLTPERVASDLDREFRHQLAMEAELPTLKVRYEDLCTRPALFDEVKRFAGIEAAGLGKVGEVLGRDAGRTDEHEVHGGGVTDRRVKRWAREEDTALRERAQRVFERMPEYCEFWGYERSE